MSLSGLLPENTNGAAEDTFSCRRVDEIAGQRERPMGASERTWCAHSALLLLKHVWKGGRHPLPDIDSARDLSTKPDNPTAASVATE